ncbi:hypothetical protein [Arthrobacter ulcerisalmonis]|uniref:hypothetical protein n=1 Tax=Arthrobacter ulcerisalmonis TaxID=2483813 RepID=UPI003625A838
MRHFFLVHLAVRQLDVVQRLTNTFVLALNIASGIEVVFVTCSDPRFKGIGLSCGQPVHGRRKALGKVGKLDARKRPLAIQGPGQDIGGHSDGRGDFFFGHTYMQLSDALTDPGAYSLHAPTLPSIGNFPIEGDGPSSRQRHRQLAWWHLGRRISISGQGCIHLGWNGLKGFAEKSLQGHSKR